MQLRLAAGISMLSTGLLIGSAGGAIAAADTDTTGSAPQSQSLDGPGSALGAASEPAASAATRTRESTLRKSVTNTVELIGRMGREQAAATRRVLTKAEDAATEKDNAATKASDDDATPLASTTTEVAPDTTAVAPVT